jgi:hypothetical protein
VPLQKTYSKYDHFCQTIPFSKQELREGKEKGQPMSIAYSLPANDLIRIDTENKKYCFTPIFMANIVVCHKCSFSLEMLINDSKTR